MPHTPGPWKLNKDKTTVYCVTRNGDEPGICSTNGEALIPLSREEQEANARLIASAPFLLAALKKVFRLAENGVIQRNETGKPQWSLTDELKTIARAAIAKAEGKE